MTSDLDSPAASSGDRARKRAYAREFWPGVAGYTVVLLVVVHWGHLDGSSPWRFVWALAPLVPALWVLRAVIRHLGRLDDYQRRLLLQGLGVGFAVAMVAALTTAFLELAGLVLDHGLAGWIVYGAGMVGWGVSQGCAERLPGSAARR